MGERTRKRKREFEDVVTVMEPGGEGFIFDPIFKIKLGTYPILKDFKVRSYLNFMASLPMKRNPETGYFEFAETAEEMTALMKAYFFPTEPSVLVDAGYERLRLSKERYLMSLLWGSVDGTEAGVKRIMLMDTLGRPRTFAEKQSGAGATIWLDEAVGAGGESPAYEDTEGRSILGVAIKVDAPTTITVLVRMNSTEYYEHTQLIFTAAGSKAQDIMGGYSSIKIRSSAAATISFEIRSKLS